MPFPNFHSFRVREPDLFNSLKVIKKLPSGIQIIGGALKAKKGTTKPQSYRFPVDGFCLEDAKSYMRKKDLSWIKAEPASQSESYNDYPQAAVDSAKKVLKWKEEHGDEVKGMTQVGWTRANQLAKRENISRATIAKMAAFERHRENSKIEEEHKGTPWKDAGYVAWEGWGGDAGIRWAQNKIEEIDRGINSISSRQVQAIKKLTGKKWRVCLIKTGRSKTGHNWGEEALKEAIPLFEGSPIYAHKYGDTFDHRPDEISNPEKLFQNLIGYVQDVRYETGADGEGIFGTLNIVVPSVSDMLLEIERFDPDKLPGLSVDVMQKQRPDAGGIEVLKISKVLSTDFVSSPAAGGEVIRAVASIKVKKINLKREEKMNPKEMMIQAMIKLIADKTLDVPDAEGKTEDELREMVVALLDKSGIDFTEQSESGVKQMDGSEKNTKQMDESELVKLVEAFKKALTGEKKEGEYKEGEKKESEGDQVKEQVAKMADQIKQAQNEINVSQSETRLENRLSKESNLEDHVKERVKQSLKGKVLKDEDIESAIKGEKEYLDRVVQSKSVQGQSFVVVTDTPKDKLSRAMDVAIDPDLKRASQSIYGDDYQAIRDAYKDTDNQFSISKLFKMFTGHDPQDVANSGELQRTLQSTTSDFPVALGDSMNKKMIRRYNFQKTRQQWSKLISEQDFTNLNKQELFRIGDFGEIPTVAESGTYTELSTPSEDNPEYTPVKKGGIFTLTEEMLINDNLRAMQMFPTKMADGAVYTLGRFVMDLITGFDGPTSSQNARLIYDNTQLYTVAHGNLGSTALTNASVEAGIAAMMDQASLSGSIPLGIAPKYLVVPPVLYKEAFDAVKNELTQANTNGGSIKNALTAYGIEPTVIPKGYLGNNTAADTAWYLAADPLDIEGCVIGYHAGKREPEIQLQDQPNVGNVFTNDQIKYRVKFRFGGAISDFRAFYAYIPAGNPS